MGRESELPGLTVRQRRSTVLANCIYVWGTTMAKIRKNQADQVLELPEVDGPQQEGSTEATTKGAVLRRYSDIETESIEWLWPGRIPLGYLTIIASAPGSGKSMLHGDITARVTSGMPWPDAQPGQSTQIGSVIVLSAEERPENLIRPRLVAMGADTNKVFDIEGIDVGDGRKRVFCLKTDLHHLEEAIIEIGDVRLVVIDSFTTHCQWVKSNDAGEVSAILTPIGQLAGRLKVAIVVIHHTNKSESSGAQNMVAGSMAFSACSRVIWAVSKDPENSLRRFMTLTKENVGPSMTGLAWNLNRTTRTLEWEYEPICMDSDGVLEMQRACRSERDKVSRQRPREEHPADVWLRGVLGGQSQIEAENGWFAQKDIMELGKDMKFSEGQIRDAKLRIGAIHSKDSVARSPSYWALGGTPRKGGGSDPDPAIPQVNDAFAVDGPSVPGTQRPSYADYLPSRRQEGLDGLTPPPGNELEMAEIPF
jgi:archaellum biogenesis ATPase FlaH